MTAFLLWPLAALELTPRMLAHLYTALANPSTNPCDAKKAR